MGFLSGNCDRCGKTFGEHSYFSEFNKEIYLKNLILIYIFMTLQGIYY